MPDKTLAHHLDFSKPPLEKMTFTLNLADDSTNEIHILSSDELGLCAGGNLPGYHGSPLPGMPSLMRVTSRPPIGAGVLGLFFRSFSLGMQIGGFIYQHYGTQIVDGIEYVFPLDT